MTAQHLEFLIEEPSMETFLRGFLPRILPTECTFQLHSFPYKRNLQRLQARLRAYARWLPNDWRLVVLVDRDRDDCLTLQQQLDNLAADAGLLPRSLAGGAPWRLVSRGAGGGARGIDGASPAGVYYQPRTTGA